MITDDQIRQAIGVEHANNGYHFLKTVEQAVPAVRALIEESHDGLTEDLHQLIHVALTRSHGRLRAFIRENYPTEYAKYSDESLDEMPSQNDMTSVAASCIMTAAQNA